MHRSHRLLVASVAVAGLVASACGSDKKPATTSTTIAATTTAPVTTAAPATTGAAATTLPATTVAPATTAAPATTGAATVTGNIVVFAASSLTDAFKAEATAFGALHPDAKLTFNFAGSSDLVTQIGQGAPADVFVSADESNMKKLTDAGESAGDPTVVARNSMEIMTEKGNPKGIATVADLTKSGLIVVLCDPSVPCGKNAAAVLKNAGATLTPASLETSVKGVVTKVTTGEADAGIVFVTDVKAAGDSATGVEIPDNLNVISKYPMVVTKESTNPTGAQAFIDFVASDAGQQILATYGFLAP